MLIPTFIAFLILLSTCCREEWQAPFGIHFYGDRSHSDSALPVQNPSGREVTGQNHNSSPL